MKTAILMSFIILFSACGGSGGGSNNDSKYSIAVSIDPMVEIVDAIAGDRVVVECLMPGNSNPESFEPSMKQMGALEKCDAFLKLGTLAFEDKLLDQVSGNIDNSKIYDLSAGIVPIEGTHGDCGHHDHDSADPHIWSSVKNAKVIAKNILDALVDTDPQSADYYRGRYNNYIAHLDSLDNEIALMLSSGNSRSFLVWHPSLSYFARDYGLDQLALGAENKELSVPALRNKILDAQNHDVNVFLLQRDFDSRQADVVNRELGAEIIYINPLNKNWEEEMIHTAKAISGR